MERYTGLLSIINGKVLATAGVHIGNHTSKRESLIRLDENMESLAEQGWYVCWIRDIEFKVKYLDY